MHTAATEIEQVLHELYGLNRLLRDHWRRQVPELSRASLVGLGVVVRKGPLRIAEIAELQHIDQSVASRQMRGLAQDGLVRSEPDPDDARGRLIAATDQGREIVESAHRRIVEALGGRLEGWTDAELSALARTLGRLHASFDDQGAAEALEEVAG